LCVLFLTTLHLGADGSCAQCGSEYRRLVTCRPDRLLCPSPIPKSGAEDVNAGASSAGWPGSDRCWSKDHKGDVLRYKFLRCVLCRGWTHLKALDAVGFGGGCQRFVNMSSTLST
jgi:hypothetical protein